MKRYYVVEKLTMEIPENINTKEYKELLRT